MGQVLRGATFHFVDVYALVFVVDLAEVRYRVKLGDDGMGSGVTILEFSVDLVEGFVSWIFEIAFRDPG